MAKRIGGTLIIEDERPQQCDDCGEIRELRLYDPGGPMVCFDCMLKDHEGAKQRFQRMMLE